MRNECTNLLPFERQQALRRDYFMRLGIVGALSAMIITGIAAVLLLPTYVFLVGSARAGEARLASIESTTSSSDETALSAQLTALSNSAAVLSDLAHAPSVSTIMREVLTIARPGVTLSGFTYTPLAGKKPGVLSISGIAATRDALRSYQLALSNTSFVQTADLPVSAYAKDANIVFTITVTLTP